MNYENLKRQVIMLYYAILTGIVSQSPWNKYVPYI